MFYLVIRQIMKWRIPESLNLMQQSLNIKFDVDFVLLPSMLNSFEESILFVFQ